MNLIKNLDELDRLDNELVIKGYLDAIKGYIDTTHMADESYMHGVTTGDSDRTGKPTPNQRVLARQFINNGGRV